MTSFFRRHRHLLLGALMAVAVALLAAACSGGDEDESPAPTQPPAATATQAPVATATRPPAPTATQAPAATATQAPAPTPTPARPPATTTAPTQPPAPAPQNAADSLTIILAEQNNSGSTGTATLTARGNQTEVTITLSAGCLESELVHIHTGQCGPTLAGVLYPLTNIASGRSTIIVNATLASLRTGGLAINAHQKGTASVYTACGNIPQAIVINLGEQNNSGVIGTATLIAAGNQTEVVLAITPGRLDSELVHIHTGQCGPTLAGVVHPLTSIANNRSVTMVNASLASVLTGNFAINAHQRGTPSVYTACGNLPQRLVINMGEQNNSGVTGTATLTALGNQTEVVLALPAGRLESELVHIHTGQCGPTLGSVVHPLTSIAVGRSYTLVNATLASVRTGNFAVNAHQKGTPSNYTACGNIPGAGIVAPTAAPTATPVPLPSQTVNSDIRNFRLENLTIRAGDSVVWTNRDGVPHTATSGSGTATGIFNTGNLSQNQASQPIRFDKAGTFPYFCAIHGASMSGTITVTNSAASAGSGTSTSSTSGPAYDY